MVAALGVRHWTTVDAGSDQLSTADGEWIALASLCAVALWGAGTVSQLGSISVPISVRRLFAVQVAASFANHVLPAGAGGIAVNLRFLTMNGLSRASAAGALGLNSAAGAITHLMLLAGVLLLSPASMSGVATPWHGWQPGLGPGSLIALLCVSALLLAGAASLWRFRRKALKLVVQEARILADVARDPARATALWLGSFAMPLLHSLILFAVLRGLDVQISMATAFAVYLVASSVSALVPSPGGFGSLDVTLVAGLAAVNVPSAAALGSVLAYRLITVWAPLLPSGFVLAYLLRRRVL
ncbi:flippase-like domain-containing protein [Actinomadura barringtoniae]|uniref:Flippase-like domain-containing protein n=1 Tax=Actinomadura barringtoniae TaxID=1427535 RepID=A0A939PJ26_9ACTN|nr:lysylphosphatidylglycerol synthase transmembrane domain-containing protein [Actinomadura barringtoniae]MBO2453197.1 flippase-like domain-containing protein [Actinomadura barringtoniae]